MYSTILTSISFYIVLGLPVRTYTNLPNLPACHPQPPSIDPLEILEVPDHLLLPQAGDFLPGFPIGSGDPTVRDIPGRGSRAIEKDRAGSRFGCKPT